MLPRNQRPSPEQVPLSVPGFCALSLGVFQIMSFLLGWYPTKLFAFGSIPFLFQRASYSNLQIILLLCLVVFIIIALSKKSDVVGNWSHLFPNMEHDPEEFYKLVEEMLAEREVPDIKTGRKIFKQGGLLSHQRLYLKVSRGDYIFHICAAPWGTGFFFSWWVRKVSPYLSRLNSKVAQYHTYYQLDTNAMFRTSVHQSVLAAIDRLTKAKGVKGLTELERKPDLRTIIK